jgi:hypothetical protein
MTLLASAFTLSSACETKNRFGKKSKKVKKIVDGRCYLQKRSSKLRAKLEVCALFFHRCGSRNSCKSGAKRKNNQFQRLFVLKLFFRKNTTGRCVDSGMLSEREGFFSCSISESKLHDSALSIAASSEICFRFRL